tara:strand:- start:96 stop:515 length:420 start_codon:yes stop_codon:yes gene_type:complete
MQPSTILRSSTAFSVSLEKKGSHRLPLLKLSALSNETIDLDTAKRVFGVTEKLLASGEDFESRWDIRCASTPRADVTWASIKWALKNTKLLREHNKRMGVLVSDSSVIRKVVSFVLRAAQVRCPVLVSSDENEIDEFLR